VNAAPATGASPADELRLEARSGKAAGFMLAVADRLVIGRQTEGPGRLADDPELSRHHAEISRAQTGEFTIKDLSSTNGTFVNGTRLGGPAVLVVGDEIEVGGTTLVVRAAPAPAAAASGAEVDVRAATVTVDVPPEMRAAPAPAADAGLTLTMSVDIQARRAQITVEGSEPIRLEFDRGAWRVAEGGD
jgi:predicted component of type VI protein secretion system